jgi:hypothetical protein
MALSPSLELADRAGIVAWRSTAAEVAAVGDPPQGGPLSGGPETRARV